MIDDKKIVGLLQAKALGCLDESDNNELQSYIDSGYIFPWNELGKYQNTASLLPLTLQTELPDAGLKDKVALRLIKLSEELKAKKLAEEQAQKILEPQEIIEEEIDEKPDEFVNLDEPFVEPPIEIETEAPVTESDIKFSEPPKIDDPVFNLDDIVLPGYEEENVNFSEPAITEQEVQPIESKPEDFSDNMVLENPGVLEAPNPIVETDDLGFQNDVKLDPELPAAITEEVKLENEWIEPVMKEVVPDVQIKAEEEKLVQEVTDPNKPDFTKRSVAEKAFKTLEQDFDMLKYRNDETEKKTKRNLVIAYLVIAFLAALLVVFFFKFNSDINQLQKEVDFLKARPSANLFQQGKIFSKLFS